MDRTVLQRSTPGLLRGADARGTPDILRRTAGDTDPDGLQSRELWLSTMLALAVKQGFVPQQQAGFDQAQVEQEDLEFERLNTGPEGSEREANVRLLLTLKTRISKLRTDLVRQSREEEQRLARQDRARVAALQEAVFYRTKLAAVESGYGDERAQLDEQRIEQLERLVTSMARENAELDRRATMLGDQAKLELRLRNSVEDRLTETTKRAVAAEEAQMKAYDELSAMQKHAYSTEALLRDLSLIHI